MTADQIIQLGGTAGLIAFLLYVVKRLADALAQMWAEHKVADAAREARLVATEAREDQLVVAVRETNSVLVDLRDQERLRLAEPPYSGSDRREAGGRG